MAPDSHFSITTPPCSSTVSAPGCGLPCLLLSAPSSPSPLSLMARPPPSSLFFLAALSPALWVPPSPVARAPEQVPLVHKDDSRFLYPSDSDLGGGGRAALTLSTRAGSSQQSLWLLGERPGDAPSRGCVLLKGKGHLSQPLWPQDARLPAKGPGRQRPCSPDPHAPTLTTQPSLASQRAHWGTLPSVTVAPVLSPGLQLSPAVPSAGASPLQASQQRPQGAHWGGWGGEAPVA